MRTSLVPFVVRQLESSAGWLSNVGSRSGITRVASQGGSMGFGLRQLGVLALGSVVAAACNGPAGQSVSPQIRTAGAAVGAAEAGARSPLPVRTLDVPVQDFKIHTKIVGDPSRGAPILAMPGGWPISHEYMNALAELATENRAYVAFDPRGVGGSTMPKDATKPWTLAELSGDIEAVRRAIGAREVHLVAHSASALNVLDYASRHPEHVASLVLIDPINPDIKGLGKRWSASW